MGFGISILLLMIPIVHFITGPIGPFIGGFIGGGAARATPLKALGIGLLMGLFMASPILFLILILQSLETWDSGRNILTYVALYVAIWSSSLGSLGAFFGGRSSGRVILIRRMR